jgi:hypothetical protein
MHISPDYFTAWASSSSVGCCVVIKMITKSVPIVARRHHPTVCNSCRISLGFFLFFIFIFFYYFGSHQKEKQSVTDEHLHNLNNTDRREGGKEKKIK